MPPTTPPTAPTPQISDSNGSFIPGVTERMPSDQDAAQPVGPQIAHAQEILAGEPALPDVHVTGTVPAVPRPLPPQTPAPATPVTVPAQPQTNAPLPKK